MQTRLHTCIAYYMCVVCVGAARVYVMNLAVMPGRAPSGRFAGMAAADTCCVAAGPLLPARAAGGRQTDNREETKGRAWMETSTIDAPLVKTNGQPF
jgi:hypothetical protein